MSEKKGLSAFINKNKKTKKSKAVQETAEQVSEQNTAVAQAAKEQEENKKNTPVGESSDEEVDELEVATKQIDYANIKENKDVSGGNQGDEKKQGFGLDDEQAPEKQKEQKKAGGMKFGEGKMTFGRPMFGGNKNKAGKFGKGDFDAGLDDLDDEGSAKKETKKSDGQREFVNLGSTAKSGQREDRPEEEVKKAAPTKPTFRGRMNLKGTGSGDTQNDTGSTPAYDFGVKYKQPEGERRERREGEEFKGSTRGGKKFGRERGEELGAKKESNQDEGFTLVRGDKRSKKTHKHDDDSSSEEDRKPQFPRGQRGGRGGFRRDEGDSNRDGFKIERRGGLRGGRGGNDE